MPNLTTPFLNLKGQDINEDMKKINEWSVSLIDELKTILCNLDSGNVTEAGSVKAQNIDVAQARIKGAQIQSLTADKLTAGTIDTGEITISNDAEKTDVYGTKNSIVIADQCITFSEKKSDGYGTVDRIVIGEVGAENESKYIVRIQNRDGTQGIYMDENGDVRITGTFTSSDGVVSGGKLQVGIGIDPVIEFMKATGTAGVTMSYSDTTDTLTIDANNVNFVCDSCTINGDKILTDEG